MRKIIQSMFISCSLLYCQQIQSSQHEILGQYETALIDLVKDHESRNAPIVLNGSNLIFSTYQKIIAPYIANVAGYALIVRQEFVKQIPYHADLQTMSDYFFTYEKEVKRIAQIFPQAHQKQAVDYFYEQLHDTMVQVCFQIIQQSSNNLTYDPKDLDSVFVAYKIVWAAQTKNMNIVGIPQGSDVASLVTQLMTTLYKAAIANGTNNLALSAQTNRQKNTIFKEIAKYHLILYQVYLNNGQNDQASREQLALQGLKKQQSQAEIAPNLFQKAQTALKNVRVPIVIDVTQPKQIQTKLLKKLHELKQVASDYALAASAYEAAQDSVGYNRSLQMQNSIIYIDEQLCMMQLAWQLFLLGSSTTKTAKEQPTFSTIQEFLQPKPSENITTQDAVQALQNLVDLCQSTSNALSPNVDILLILDGVINAVSSNNAPDIQVTMGFLADIKEAIQTLVQVLQFMIQATTSKDKKDIANAMTYASHLDSLFEKNKDIAQYVAFLPDILNQGNNPGFAGQATWTQFTAQFLVSSNVVSTVANAIAQIGKYKQPSTAELSSPEIKTLQSQAQSDFNQAAAAQKNNDFSTAVQNYENMKNIYLKLLNLPSLPSSQTQTFKAQYFLANSLWTASSLASTISTVGSQSLGSLHNVPISYVARAYQTPAIDVTLLGLTTLPATLSSAAQGQFITTLNAAQQKDVQQLYKAYLVSKVIADQSAQFSDCFVDYQLKTVAHISSVNQSIATQAVQQVEEYLKNISSSHLAIQIMSPTSLVIILYNAPINAVTPLYTSAPIAADYFLGAQLLFQPGTSLVALSGNMYVPGNDALAATMMLEKVAYAYASAAMQEIAQAQGIMNELLKEIGGDVSSKTVPSKGVTVKAKTKKPALPKDFTTVYSQVKKGIARSQSLLVASQQSAQAYFYQAGNTQYDKDVQAAYLNLYQTLITFMKQCLVGDPFSAEYNNILSDLNTTYLQWGVELDPVKDAAQITKLNQDIVNLFVTAGNQCLVTYYIQSLYPNFKQIHYLAATKDFIAAQKKYTAMGDKKNADAMQDKINKAYFLACDQNIELYFYVKNNGITYTSQTNGQVMNVPFQQLLADYNNFEQNGAAIDPSEQEGYNSVQSLLLDAAMVYQNLAQYFAKQTPVDASTTQKTNPVDVATTKKTNPSGDQKVIKYLQSLNLIPQSVITIEAIPFYQVGLKEKILLNALHIYDHFLTDAQAMSSFINFLITIVQNIYMEDYLGATATQTSTELENQTKEFFDAEQKEASSLQNPSSAYVG